MKPWTSYYENLIIALKDPEEATAYLNAALEAGDREAFLLALRNVLEAQGGMTKASRSSKIHRVSLYKMLSKNGNPSLESILTLLNTIGVRLQFVERERKKLRRAA